MSSTANGCSLQYQYDPGEHLVKHCWNQPLAGFQKSGSASIGKCPITLLKSTAETLLKNGIPAYYDRNGFPAKIYNIYEGVIYEARQRSQTVLITAIHGGTCPAEIVFLKRF